MASDGQASTVPILGEGFQENKQPPKAKSTSDGAQTSEMDAKTGKRRFWGLGKKKDDDKMKKNRESAIGYATPTSNAENKVAMRPSSPQMGGGNIPVLTQTTSHPYASPSSPTRNFRSSSPAPPSPASSQIFERHVQEDSLAIREQAPVPGHITTENHIPPVLDASTEAITNDELDPDNVEIVMHSAHQPAAVTVTGAGSSEATGTSWPEDLTAHPDTEDAASNYGALDSADVRRLSFISFADVVHAEAADHSGSLATGMISPAVPHNRSPSPVRSPLSSQGLSRSSNLSGSGSSRGLETSPNRGGMSLGSPYPGHSPPSGGELTIETMRQALRKTGSGDLSGARSTPLSATGGDDGNIEHPFK
ncbi:MAG: hypothetical protein Q9164_001215 [Protoblastenia rupestris]